VHCTGTLLHPRTLLPCCHVQDTKQLQILNPRDDFIKKLQEELAEAYKQQLHSIVRAQKQQGEPDAFDEAAAPAAAAASQSDEPAPVVRVHRFAIVETDGSDSDEEGGSDSSSSDGSSGSSGSGGSGSVVPVAPKARPAAAAAAAAAPEPPAAAAAAAKAKPVPQRTLSAPKSATEFLTTAKSLLLPPAAVTKPQAGTTQATQQPQQQQDGQLGQYVKLLEPSQYPVVFKTGLNPNDAPLLLQGLQQIAAEDLGFAEQGLRALVKVPRFGVVYAMLGKGSKGLVREMVGQLEAAGRDVSVLKSAYKL
jgi:hypothetical protein